MPYPPLFCFYGFEVALPLMMDVPDFVNSM